MSLLFITPAGNTVGPHKYVNTLASKIERKSKGKTKTSEEGKQCVSKGMKTFQKVVPEKAAASNRVGEETSVKGDESWGLQLGRGQKAPSRLSRPAEGMRSPGAAPAAAAWPRPRCRGRRCQAPAPGGMFLPAPSGVVAPSPPSVRVKASSQSLGHAP